MKKEATSPRRRGRPPSFEREAVLKKAMLTFWALGYEGASIADLTAAMGITAQSLYAAFGSKSALYREALHHYQHTVGAYTALALQQEPTALEAFKRILTESATEFCRSRRPRGCMVSTSSLACAVENQEEVRHVAQLREATIGAFRERIDRAIAQGEFKPETDSTALARYLGAIVQGMAIQARDGATRAQLQQVAALAITTLQQFST
ncbi:TetR family transcriptional regulator [Lampropedia cohaerens]|uniref:TetR family transcriptional regulator n=1 Tax=Lampropedia cohaerens TaxID=1610491 RepID=A0A0U1PX80_9BURK|nr:TetR/AcrR family transcriptional regulator [Lampropedia cohaerens]KKW67100.1 TetR family transcriptional regulator [Lampropedia cohaerens]